jgi:hypothetical protein
MLGSPQADAAGIAAVAGLLTALYAHWRTAKHGRELEALKYRLDSQRDERNARRDYEYEARKRLYTEIEPLLFQLHEAAEQAYHRALSLARTSRNGNLGGQDGWLAREGYYLRSTLYALLLPAVLFRLIQRRMTFVDLDVDATTRVKYELAKLYFIAPTDHYEFAGLEPALEYRPDEIDAKASAGDRRIFARQGIVLGHLDQIVEVMIVKEGEGERAATYGEFDKILSAPNREKPLRSLVAIFTDFEPSSRPILARAVIALAAIASLLMRSFRARCRTADLDSLWCEMMADEESRVALAWATDAPQDFSVLQAYFETRFRRMDASTESAGPPRDEAAP